jgi:hypothetical protein
MALGLKDVSLALVAAHTRPLASREPRARSFSFGLGAISQGESDWVALAKISAKNEGL